jgi:uncharacterized protein
LKQPRHPAKRAGAIAPPQALFLTVRVIPNASKTDLAGRRGEALKVKVREPALEGRANAALIAFLSDTLGCPKSAIRVARGETSRDKTIAITLPDADHPGALRRLGLG